MLHLVTMSTLHLVKCLCHGYMFVGGVHEGSQGTGLQAKKVIRFHNLHLTSCILTGERQCH